MTGFASSAACRGEDSLVAGQNDKVFSYMGERNYDDGVAQRSTVKTPGSNRSGAYGRWAPAETTDVYTIADELPPRPAS